MEKLNVKTAKGYFVCQFDVFEEFDTHFMRKKGHIISLDIVLYEGNNPKSVWDNYISGKRQFPKKFLKQIERRM